ncbi:C39 family peptidase [Litoribrevibacter euphylliae]|uniref:C39 family peptidase n=1 Tax=Litoribrevibacter euphylliae TaxID=1834034 RepID=A0ABV7H790_9GAMM
MIIVLLGSLVALFGVYHVAELDEHPKDTVFFEQAGNQYVPSHTERTSVAPISTLKYKNVVRQAYDYSCGSAALTTLLDYYLGRNFQERHVMEGLLEYGEAEKIVERKGFSLLDMKRLVTALGHPSGGFKATVQDLLELEHPGIVPIEYAGFKHFVVLRQVKDGRVFVADPALGNLSFTLERFQEVWDRNVIFIVFPGDKKPIDALAIRDEDLRYVDESTIHSIAFAEPISFITAQEHNLSTEVGNRQKFTVIIDNGEDDPTTLEVNLNPIGDSKLYYRRK